jgi:diguanylate cyclase (GGDEF)-like protein
MRHTFTRISNRMTTALSLFFGLTRQHADQTQLTRYIVAINRQKSTEEIINQAALCLKEMLGYRLFAFVVKKETAADVWLDPRMYKKSLEKVIVDDFNMTDKTGINYLNHSFYPGEDSGPSFDLSDLVYYELNEKEFTARIYMLPKKRTGARHDEVVNLILQGSCTALLRQTKIETLTDAAVIDPLTGCYNRREFETQLNRNISGATRYQNPLSIFMFDLDHFKRINDTFGHQAGDKVLQHVVKLVQRNMRTGDILARYGGEEFIAILPETGKVKAMELADRLRKRIAKHPVAYGGDHIKVTASFGVAQLNRQADMSHFIQDADTMLYKAKLNGRNTVMPGLIKVVEKKTRHGLE